MAVYISDSIYGAVPLPLDAKTSNVVPQGAYTKVESVTEYLARVDIFSRYLGLIVAMSHPDGVYENNELMQKIATGEITVTLYAFISGIEDEDFLPWCPSCDPPIIQTRWTVVSSTCELDEQGKRTGIVQVLEKEEKKVDDGPWSPTGQTRIVSNYNPILCPLPSTREVEVSRECLLAEGENNGYLKIIYNVEQQTEEGDWIVVQENQERTVYDAVECPVPVEILNYRWVDTNSACIKVGGYNNSTLRTYRKEQVSVDGGEWTDTGNTDYVDTFDNVTCPLPQFRWTTVSSTCELSGGYNTGNLLITQNREVSENSGGTWTPTGETQVLTEYNTGSCPVVPFGAWMSVGPVGGYNMATDTLINFTFGSPVFLQTPILINPDDYSFFYLSIPTGRTFTITDSIGMQIRSEFSQVGFDNRTGYRGNTVYMKADGFDAEYPAMFNLTIY